MTDNVMVGTPAIIANLKVDITVALAMGQRGSLGQEAVALLLYGLRKLEAKNLTEAQHNAAVRLLIAGILDLAHARDPKATRVCPLVTRLQEAITELSSNKG